MDRVIDFNELKNKVNDKDIDKFEAYIYDLYYKMAEGKINMADFNREISAYMDKNSISQDKFMKIQAKLMERYGFDSAALEEQMKALGLNNIVSNDYEKGRRMISFQEKYKSRIKVRAASEYYIKNEKNNINIWLEDVDVIIRSEGKIDLTDVELNEFLCSYKKVVDERSLKISICENIKEYDY